MKTSLMKWSDVLLGTAYGDAWGYKNEFHSYKTLTKKQIDGPDLPQKLIISDDTQMTLALARALSHAGTSNNRQLQSNIIYEYVQYSTDPDNTRAPGRTVMSACAGLRQGKPWPQATVMRSDGCGTVMRVSPCAFLDEDRWGPASAFSAAVTHGNPNGIAAAVTLAATIRAGVTGEIVAGETIAYAQDFASAHPDAAVFTEWISRVCTPHQLEGGFVAVNEALQDAGDGLEVMEGAPWSGDPCTYGGPGWRAQHCLATALLCVDVLPDDPISALRRATVTDGDSDSIAAVAGAVLGAVHGHWPGEWFNRLEPRYQRWINQAVFYDFA
jgi:ADP-ribosylglycohydrolase